jgi:signal transduction histidine kinase
MRATAATARCDLSFRAVGSVEGVWDRLRIEQVTMNLLSNSIKFGAGAPVEVSLRRDGQDVIIEVADRGPGLAEADLTRIFDRFERAVSARHYGGLGLGLYVTREIVEAHGGTVTARNRPDGGACFTIRLSIEPRSSGRGPTAREVHE